MSETGCWYEIRVAERLEEHWQTWFSDIEMLPVNEEDDAGSLLRGRLPDQAALFGLLARVRSLNLTLLEVRRLTDG